MAGKTGITQGGLMPVFFMICLCAIPYPSPINSPSTDQPGQ
nr:MAG TPA: hypothetical protein [Caudoviricetes sp.]